MAKLEVQILGNASNFKNVINEVTGLSDKFGSSVDKSSTQAVASLDKVDESVKKVERSFSVLTNPSFSFGVNIKKQVESAVPSVQKLSQEVEKVNRSFKLLSNPSFTFGANFGKDIQSAIVPLQKVPAAFNNAGKGIGSASLQFQGFSRVLQDAAFGPAAIANNLEQAVGDIRNIGKVARESGQSIGQVLVKSLTGGGGLNLALGGLTLGLSLASFGMSAWTRLFPENKKKVDDAKLSTEEYIATLDAVRGAMLKGSGDSQQEITNLKLLYSAATNASLGTKERINASKQLQSQYQKDFGNYSKEQIMLGEARSAYDRLTTSILASARARAAAGRITENAVQVLTNQSQITDMNVELNLAEDRLKLAKQILSANISAGINSITAEREVYNATSARDAILTTINEKAKANAKLEADSANLAKQANLEFAKGGTLYGDLNDKAAKTTKEIKKQADLLKDILNNIPKIELPQFTNGVFARGINLGTGLDVNSSEGYQALRVQMEADLSRWSSGTKDVSEEWTKQMSFAVQRFGRDFYKTLTGINQLADRSFGNVFATLTNGLTSSFSEIFLTQVTDGLKVSFEKGFEKIDFFGLDSKIGKTIAAGAGIAGGLISGITSPTSTVGQGLGGALSGAGVGAVLGSAVPGIGTAIGAAAGGLLGALGGIFGASSAKKQQRLQEEALIEQKKQTALMERQNALAYASQIVGRMAKGIGIISNADIDATGQVVLGTVTGEQINLVLERFKKNR